MKDRALNVLLVLIAFILTRPGYAQFSPGDVWKLPAHTDATKMSWWKHIYHFQDFQEGRVTFLTGFTAQDKFRFNHNLYFGGIDMINQNGDTVQMKSSREIKYVKIGNQVFLNDLQKGYVELLVQLPVSLGSVTSLHLESMIYVSGNTKGETSRLEVRGRPSIYDRYYKKTTVYYLIDKRNKLHKALKPYFFQVFPGHKEKISAYLDEQKVDFNNEEQLIALVKYCNQLNQLIPPEDENTILVRAGQSLSGVAGESTLRRFPTFEAATISYTNGDREELKLNYNIYSGDMDVIRENGDTVKLKRASYVKTINVDGIIFLHDDSEGFAEILLHGPISLGVRRIMATIVAEDISGEHTESITSDMYYKGSSPFNVSPHDKFFVKQSRYFFIDQRHQFYHATRASLLKLYPAHKETISAYLREKNIDFDKEEDLKQLESFCVQLQN